MFVNMLPIKHETYPSHGKIYSLHAFIEIETQDYRVFVYEGATPLPIDYGASGDVASDMAHAKMDVVDALIKAAKQDVDAQGDGILGMRSWSR